MAITKVYIKKPKNISDKELRKIFKKMKVRVKITENQLQVHTTNWNENGIFCLGMDFQKQLIINHLQRVGDFIK